MVSFIFGPDLPASSFESLNGHYCAAAFSKSLVSMLSM